MVMIMERMNKVGRLKDWKRKYKIIKINWKKVMKYLINIHKSRNKFKKKHKFFIVIKFKYNFYNKK